jgi:hypothetical protein
VRGGAAAVQQPRIRQGEGSGAQRDDAAAAGMSLPQRVQQILRDLRKGNDPQNDDSARVA